MGAEEAGVAAAETWEAIETLLEDPGTGLFGERPRRGSRWLARKRLVSSRSLWRYEHLWPFTGAWSARIALCSLGGPTPNNPSCRDGLSGQLRAVDAYRSEPVGGLSAGVVSPLGPGGERYFDDNAWVGLALCRHAQLCDAKLAEALASRLVGFLETGWMADQSVSSPGGIRWKEGRGRASRNTCANAPSAALAARVYLLHGNPAHLELAQRIYAWTRSTLGDERGLYADRIAPDGTVEAAVLSYNQGAMIGAGMLLQEATGKARYLDEARQTATSAINRYRSGDALARESPGFVAIFLRNLLALAIRHGQPGARAMATDYGTWLLGRRGADKLVRFWTGEDTPLLASAALVEVLALVAGAPAAP